MSDVRPSAHRTIQVALVALAFGFTVWQVRSCNEKRDSVRAEKCDAANILKRVQQENTSLKEALQRARTKEEKLAGCSAKLTAWEKQGELQKDTWKERLKVCEDSRDSLKGEYQRKMEAEYKKYQDKIDSEEKRHMHQVHLLKQALELCQNIHNVTPSTQDPTND